METPEPGRKSAHVRHDVARRIRNADLLPRKLSIATSTVTSGVAIGTDSPPRSTNTYMPPIDSGRLALDGISGHRVLRRLVLAGPGVVELPAVLRLEPQAERFLHLGRRSGKALCREAPQETRGHDGALADRCNRC